MAPALGPAAAPLPKSSARLSNNRAKSRCETAGNPARLAAMFSHVVIFWTDPSQPGAADELAAAANRILPSIPGILQCHVGKMVPSHRPVVEQTFQVGLNLIFPDRKAHDNYQTHPAHVEFVDKFVKKLVKKVVIYDFA